MYKTIAKVAAVLAILGLIGSSFILTAGALFVPPPDAESHAAPTAAFSRDLTIGATGADVRALQTWLIGKGFVISAGATGYFGGQTRSALALYQASAGITPAAGYFGPITRAKVNAEQKPVLPPLPAPDNSGDDEDNDEDDNDTEELEIEVTIRNDRAYVEAEVDGDEESFTLNTTRRSQIIEDIAERLDLSESDVEEVIEIREEDEDEDREVSASATVSDRDGADNDVATFKLEVELEAFGDDIYVDTDASTSFVYEIQDADGDAVTSFTSSSELLRSSADEDGGYYVIDEDEEETFTLTVTFNPLTADEGAYYRLQLIEILFNDSAASPDRDWNASPASEYQTGYVYIID